MIHSAATGPKVFVAALRRFACSLASGFLALVFLAGCHDPLVVPQIEPVAAGLEDGFAGVSGIKIHAFNTGSILSVEAAVWAGGS